MTHSSHRHCGSHVSRTIVFKFTLDIGIMPILWKRRLRSKIATGRRRETRAFLLSAEEDVCIVALGTLGRKGSEVSRVSSMLFEEGICRVAGAVEETVYDYLSWELEQSICSMCQIFSQN
jgi:hypothetical protein